MEKDLLLPQVTAVTVIESMDSGIQTAKVQILPPPLLTVTLASYKTLLCEIGIIIVPIIWYCYED